MFSEKHEQKMHKFAFAQESLYLHTIIQCDINEPGISLVYKRKHMLKNGAPPDNFSYITGFYTGFFIGTLWV